MDKPLDVHADWDTQAGVWVATSNDVAGLATEARTVEGLVEKLAWLIPELLRANRSWSDQPLSFELLARRFDHLRPAP